MADSDQETTPQAPPQQFAIQRIYTKDISFETPNSPAIFREKWQPEINVELNAAAQPLEENIFEVVLSVTVTAKVGEKTAYLVEVQQAGIFSVAGFGEQEREAMLYSFCPNILFPYAREVVTNLITKGSFPQMVLSPVNFDALYARHLAQKQEQGGNKPVH